VVSPAEILDDAVRVAAAGATAEVSVEVEEGISPVQVDRSQILQVFPEPGRQRPPGDAAPAAPREDYAPRRQHHAGRGADATARGRHYVMLEVRDNASGIKSEHLERIWDPFFTTKKHGTGLGLATVLSIVRKHGGQIGVGSELGLGTVFTVFLPVADKPVEVQARRAPSLRFGTGRVLFMDDDPTICALTAAMLQSLDYNSTSRATARKPSNSTGATSNRPAVRRRHHGHHRHRRHGRRGDFPRAQGARSRRARHRVERLRQRGHGPPLPRPCFSVPRRRVS